VPQFFFHFSDGSRQFTDAGGIDLDGLRAARAHATDQVRELKAAMCDPYIQDLSGWSMSVADARGRTVFVLGFDLKPRATAPARPQQASPGAPQVSHAAPARANAAKPPSGRTGAAAKN
jgi:hypothetical protein